jgi:predicted RNase H-like nuclease (RuvC/YqgF family)
MVVDCTFFAQQGEKQLFSGKECAIMNKNLDFPKEAPIMAESRTFRSALNGFNREDVVRYIESLNTKHTTLVNQLNSELQSLTNELEGLRAQLAEPAVSDEEHTAVVQERDALLTRVAELEAYCDQLEQQLAQCAAPCEQKPVENVNPTASEELEAYRRAERAERMAKERAELVYHQVNGVLAEATSKVDTAAADIGAMAEQDMQQLIQLQSAVAGSKDVLCDAASTMNAIKPNN